MEAATANMQPAEAENLASLSNLDEQTMVKALHARYNADRIYVSTASAAIFLMLSLLVSFSTALHCCYSHLHVVDFDMRRQST